MLKKSLKIFSCLLIGVVFSCAKKEFIPEPYILSSFPEVQKIERQDHKFCNSLDLNSGNSNKSVNDDLYWHCRLSAAKFKLDSHVGSAQSLNHNSQISDLITKISLRLSETHESVFIKENKKIDARQHKQCVDYGFDFDINDQLKTDQYLLCRKRLIDDDQLDPPYGNQAYLKYPNRSYNLGFVLNNKIDSEIKRRQEAEKNYPYCLQFFNNSDNFAKCTKAQDDSRQCLTQIDGKRFKKESEKKTFCQKQAYLRFPDSFLKESDQKKEDIERAKTNADVYNQNSFAALGINSDDIELFESEETADAEYEKQEKQKKLEKNINSKKALYTRYELTRLRQKYIISCTENADLEVKKYVEAIKKSCDDLGSFKADENMI
ncbi:MAG: hypothetical protein EBS06_03895 [Proteobacteria bacterium]|nr:hypothetical protein [Pseudomonadota bacterium]